MRRRARWWCTGTPRPSSVPAGIHQMPWKERRPGAQGQGHARGAAVPGPRQGGRHAAAGLPPHEPEHLAPRAASPGASGAAVRRAGRRSHRGAHRGRLPRPSPGRRRPRLPGRRSARSGPPCSGRGSRWPPWPHPGRARRPPQEARRDGPGQAGLAHPKAIKRKIRVDNVISVSQLAPYSSLTSSFRATRFFPLQCALRR